MTRVVGILWLVIALPHLGQAVLSVVRLRDRVFEVDYEHDRFLKDGEPFRYISGSLHYFRIPRPYWRDRLRKCRAAGLNAISTYVEWSFHEPHPGQFYFSGDKDLVHFIRLAQEEGLLVILRPGPYICTERDLGGYPSWLFHKNLSMRFRTSDPSHIKYVYLWLTELFPRIQPLLYGNGGPIIMVQVENEYGSYVVCDRDYTLWLRDLFLEFIGNKAVLFTTDGAASCFLRCGPIPGVLTTVDFGAVKNVSKAFGPLRELQRHGPLVNSEFYPGRLTHWGDPGMSRIATKEVVDSTRQLLLLNASFNFYMFHGGTNFGLTSGANNPPFKPQITSYDFDAPITESGNLTEKYYAIKSVISEFISVKDIPVSDSSTREYGTITLKPRTSLWNSGTGISYGQFQYPQSLESLELYSGLMMYETLLPAQYTGLVNLHTKKLHDRAIVYVNKEPIGLLNRTDKSCSFAIKGEGHKTLGLLVENQGHINYKNMSDLKGLLGHVTLNGVILRGWQHTGFPLKNVFYASDLPEVEVVHLPAFFYANFFIPKHDIPQDTFLDMRGWGKGVVYVNGFNLGRYWPLKGPQTWLYLPAPVLRHSNSILLLELEVAHPNYTIHLLDEPPTVAFTLQSVRTENATSACEPGFGPDNCSHDTLLV